MSIGTIQFRQHGDAAHHMGKKTIETANSPAAMPPPWNRHHRRAQPATTMEKPAARRRPMAVRRAKKKPPPPAKATQPPIAAARGRKTNPRPPPPCHPRAKRHPLAKTQAQCNRNYYCPIERDHCPYATYTNLLRFFRDICKKQTLSQIGQVCQRSMLKIAQRRGVAR